MTLIQGVSFALVPLAGRAMIVQQTLTTAIQILVSAALAWTRQTVSSAVIAVPVLKLLEERVTRHARISTSVQGSTAGMEASAVRRKVRQTRANTRVRDAMQDTWAGQECLRHVQTSTSAQVDLVRMAACVRTQ